MHTSPYSAPPRCRRAGSAAAPLLLLGVLVIVVVGFVAFSSRGVPDGPVPVVWDKTPCAFCAMHLGEPRFAAQLTTTSGETYFYDDPGCLFLHQHRLEAEGIQIHVRWFHELERDAWLEAAEVAFQRSEHTPMAHGFGAVPRGSADSISLEAALADVLAQ